MEIGAGALPSKVGIGLVRLTPFVGAWINGIGFVKTGLAYWQAKETDAQGQEHSQESRDLSIQIGSSFGGSGKPYVIASYTRGSLLSEQGDVAWSEWGTGVGTLFFLSPQSAIVAEGEYRLIEDHYNPIRDVRIDGSRFQIHIGFLGYLY